MFLGIGGKVVPTITRMAKPVVLSKRIVGVARFFEARLQARLGSWNIETIVCDMLEGEFVASLPDLLNNVYMAGRSLAWVSTQALHGQ